MTEREQQGLTLNEYKYIHIWLIRTYGKADKCTNPDCDGRSHKFDRALIHGKLHDRDPDNYIFLCRRCHLKYDEIQIGEKNSFYGKKHSEKVRAKISVATKGENNPMYNHIYTEETKEKMRKNNSGQNNPMSKTNIERRKNEAKS